MKLFYALITLIIFQSCSFDNKSGIWKNVNEVSEKDVGIFNEDFNTEIINEMKKEGFVNYRNLGNLEKGYEMSFRLKNSSIGKWAKIDIFVHNKNTLNKLAKQDTNPDIKKLFIHFHSA